MHKYHLPEEFSWKLSKSESEMESLAEEKNGDQGHNVTSKMLCKFNIHRQKRKAEKENETTSTDVPFSKEGKF